MFDVIYDVDKLSKLFGDSDQKEPKTALSDRLDALLSTNSNFHPGGYYVITHEMAEMPYVGFGQF